MNVLPLLHHIELLLWELRKPENRTLIQQYDMLTHLTTFRPAQHSTSKGNSSERYDSKDEHPQEPALRLA